MDCYNIETNLAHNIDAVFNMQTNQVNCVALNNVIRGLEYVKRYNPIFQREEIVLRNIEGHPLNEYGINQIMQQLKVVILH
jgi:hypothetical protein